MDQVSPGTPGVNPPDIRVFLCFGKITPESEPRYFHQVIPGRDVPTSYFGNQTEYTCPVTNITLFGENEKFSRLAASLYHELRGCMDDVKALGRIREFLDAHRELLHSELRPTA